MTTNRSKKNVKQRGSKTHGYGSMKKHRGAGSRGGRGNAGSGKRADVKKPSFLKQGRVMGKNGFKSPLINQYVPTINLALINQRLAQYVDSAFANKTKEGYELDLSKIGVEKLLGTGKVTEKLFITVDYASAKSIEKVEAAGGKVTVVLGGDGFEASEEAEEVVVKKVSPKKVEPKVKATKVAKEEE